MIKEVCWDEVPIQIRSNLFPENSHLYAIWPTPVDHDVCFKEAGFTKFDDSDETWDNDFSNIVQIIFLHFHIADNLKEPLLLASQYDDRPYFIHNLHHPFNVRIVVTDGHPIIWIWMEKDLIDDLLQKIEEYKSTKKVVLDWNKLIPEEHNNRG